MTFQNTHMFPRAVPCAEPVSGYCREVDGKAKKSKVYAMLFLAFFLHPSALKKLE